MTDAEITLDWAQVDVHGNITGKVRGMQEDEDKYTDMLIAMNKFMENEQNVSVLPYHPALKDFCAGKAKDGIWYRVRIDHLESRGVGLYANCFLVDEGEEQILPVTRLRYMPEKFASDTEHQVKRIHLHGLQPQTLLMSPEDLSVYPGPRTKWDEAAVRYMKDHIEDCKHIRCNVMEKHSDGSLSVRMYLQSDSGGYMCLNDKLVSNDFATETAEMLPPMAKNQHKSIEDMIRNRKQKHARRIESQKKSVIRSEYKDSTSETDHYSTQDRYSVRNDKRSVNQSTDMSNVQRDSGYQSVDQKICSRIGVRSKTMTKKLEDESQAESDHEHSENDDMHDSMPELSLIGSCSESETGKSLYQSPERGRPSARPEQPVKIVQPVGEGETYIRAKTYRGRGCSPSKATRTLNTSNTGDQLMSPIPIGRGSSLQQSLLHVPHHSDESGLDITTWNNSREDERILIKRKENTSPLTEMLGVGRGRPRLDSDTDSLASIFRGRGSPSPSMSSVGRGILQPGAKSLRSVSPSSQCSLSDTPKGRGALLLSAISNTSSRSTTPVKLLQQSANSTSTSNERFSDRLRNVSGLGSCSESDRFVSKLENRSERLRNVNGVSSCTESGDFRYLDSCSESEINRNQKIKPQVQNSGNSSLNSNLNCAINREGNRKSYDYNGQGARPKIAMSGYNGASGSESDKGRPLARTLSQQSLIAGSCTGEIEFKKARIPKQTSTGNKIRINKGSSRQSDSNDCRQPQPQPRRPYMNTSDRERFSSEIGSCSESDNFRNHVFRQESGIMRNTGSCPENVHVRYPGSRSESDVYATRSQVPVIQQVRSDNDNNTHGHKFPASEEQPSVRMQYAESIISKPVASSNNKRASTVQDLLSPRINILPAGMETTEDSFHESVTSHNKPEAGEDFISNTGFRSIVSRRDIATENKKSEVISKMQGQRLLDALGPVTAKPTMQVEVGRGRKFQSTDRVLVHGGRLKPCMDIRNSCFSEPVIKAFLEAKHPAPKLVQACSWPLIMRGRLLVTVSPRDTGKTLAYLYPLLSYFAQPEIYSDIRRNGMGAIVIILTWTWEHAEQVHYETLRAVSDKPAIKVLMVHGGGLEENKACELINGCDILITTPPSLKRILHGRYTDLRRLCHLVIDDADQVLDIFNSEMNYILDTYTLVIANKKKNYQCPRQILVFGSKWNKPMRQFMENRLDEPVLLIVSQFEAAIYGKVRQIPHMCRQNNKLQKVLAIVDQLTGSPANRIIIFASKTHDAILLHDTLSKYSHYSVMVHEDMDLHQALEVAEQWPMKVLICCDKYVSEMRIDDATSVIHYDMNCTKTEFGNRVGCMRKYFYNFTSTKETQPSATPVSHIIISEDCVRQAKSLTELLERSKTEKPKELKCFMDGILEAQEEDEERDLCGQILAYGSCRDKWLCKDRHSVIADIDVTPNSDWLPMEGEVKVLVTYIIDASHYYVRVLGVRGEDQIMHDMSTKFSQLQMDLAIWYTDSKHQKRHAAPFTGEVCGYQQNEMFFRVQILNIMEMNTKGRGMFEAKIQFVDSGREDVVNAAKLYELPEHLKAFPFQAVEVYVCKVRPVDKDTTWTHKANHFMCDLLDGKELEGKIVLRLGYTLWLDPLVLRVRLGETRAIINKFYIHTELVRNGLADENRNHLDRLYKLCEGKVEVPRALLIKTKMSQDLLRTDVLPACRQNHTVHVSSVQTPDLFFVQRAEKLNELESLMEDITKYVENQAEDDVLQEIEVGKYCLAQYASFDQRWYRGQIQKVTDDNVQIFFADYGDSDTVPKDKIREFPVDKFLELPLQAIECKLDHITELDTSWDDKAGDAMWDLSHYVNSCDYRPLKATVAPNSEQSKYAGRHKFVIELVAKYDSHKLDMAQELVWRQLAKPVDNSPYLVLVPKPKIGMRMYPSLLHKVPNLVSSCYWDQDPNKAIRIAEEILKLLKNHLSSLTSAQEQVALDGVECLVKLVSRVTWANIHHVILDCLVCYARNGEKFCELMSRENIVSSVTRCLEMNSDSIIQHHAADFIGQVASVSTVLKSKFQCRDSVSVLYELLECTQCQHVQGSVCRAFAALCSGSECLYEYLMKKSVCVKLVSCLSKSTDHIVSEGVLTLVDTLSQHDSGHDDLRKESLIEAIVKNLCKTNCDKCIQFSVLQCDHFASTRRKHKTFLIEKEMILILNRILELNLQSSTLQICRDLKTSLDFKVPQEPMAGLSFRPDSHKPMTSSHSVVAPPIHWSNNSFAVTLAVKVTGVKGHGNDIVTFTEDSIKFRASAADGVCYGFHYKLVDRIIVEKCRCAVKTREVLISMRKAKEGKWSRLLHDKHKPANLFVDHERFVDSSDSEVCDDSRPFILAKKKKIKTFKCIKGPKDVEVELRDHESDTTDSLENLELYDDKHGDEDYYHL